MQNLRWIAHGYSTMATLFPYGPHFGRFAAGVRGAAADSSLRLTQLRWGLMPLWSG